MRTFETRCVSIIAADGSNMREARCRGARVEAEIGGLTANCDERAARRSTPASRPHHSLVVNAPGRPLSISRARAAHPGSDPFNTRSFPRSGLPDTHIHTFASTLANRKSAQDYVSQEAHAAYLPTPPTTNP